jgi:RNA polymerase sigma-70 factor (ECF subfamily)
VDHPLDRRELSAALARLAAGDRSAFDGVFTALWPVLRGFGGRLLAHPADAEDAAQSALIKVFAQASRYDTQRDGLSWALAITAWECRTTRTRVGRRREDPLSVPLLSGDVAESVLAADLRAAVRELADDLRPEDAETLAILFDDSPRPDLAPATFRKRVQRAIDRFARLWRTRHGTP